LLSIGDYLERTTTMQRDAFIATPMAACRQRQSEFAERPEGRPDRRQRSGAIDILTISDNPTLSVYLSGLFHESGWTIARVRTFREAVALLKNTRVAVAVCEECLPDGLWQDTAAALRSMPEPPALIVVGDDQSLVHEITALGGFDVLVRPLRESEVVWTIASAWHAWTKRVEGAEKGAP